MSNSADAEIKIDGDVSPLRRQLAQLAKDFNEIGSKAEKGIGGALAPLEALQGKLLAVGAVLAGGAMFKTAVDAAAKLTEESIQLGRALGVSATQAGGMIAAIEDVGATQEEFAAASKGLVKNLANHEQALQSMGLTTRDAAGNLRPMNELMLDGIGLVNQYADGADRNAAAQAVFGKGVDGASKLLNLQAETVRENLALQESLGAMVGQTSVENFRAYDSAMDKVALTLKAVQTTIGNAVMPVLTKLGEWFVSIGPAAMTVVRGAVGGVVAAFWGLKNAVTIVWETINAMVVTVAEPIRALGEAIVRALAGDWSGAKAAVAGIGDTISAAWGGALDEMLASSVETRDRIVALFAQDAPAAVESAGTRRWTGGGDKDKGKGGAKKEATADPGLMAYYEAALAEEKRLASERDALRQFSKADELAYWNTLLQYADLNAKDRVAISKRVADLEVTIRSESAQQQAALEAEIARGVQQRAVGEVEIARAAADAAVAADDMTQQRRLVLEEQFQLQIYEIRRAALEREQQMLEQDPNATPAARRRVLNEQLALEQQYQQQMLALRARQSQQGGLAGMFDGMGNSLGNALDGMLTRTRSWSQSITQIWGGLRQNFIRTMVSEPLQAWLGNLARMLAAKLGFATTEGAIEKTAAATSVTTTTTAAMTKVGANAATAGSGAASAMASIPYVGPILALAAMAAMVAAVMGMKSNIKSARGGYDIPAGVNPMTQLHEEEMVLPAKYANTIRDLAGRPGDGGEAPAPISVSISAVDARSVRRLFEDHGGALADALRKQVRNFGGGVR